MAMTLQQVNPVHMRVSFIASLAFILAVFWLTPVNRIYESGMHNLMKKDYSVTTVSLENIQTEEPPVPVQKPKVMSIDDNGKEVETIVDTDIPPLDKDPVIVKDEPVFIPFSDPPVALTKVNPVYPPLAMQAGIFGKVYLTILIDTDGKVLKAVIVKSDNEMFNQPAIDAAMKTKYKPAKNNGVPVKVWFGVVYNFVLH